VVGFQKVDGGVVGFRVMFKVRGWVLLVFGLGSAVVLVWSTFVMGTGVGGQFERGGRWWVILRGGFGACFGVQGRREGSGGVWVFGGSLLGVTKGVPRWRVFLKEIWLVVPVLGGFSSFLTDCCGVGAVHFASGGKAGRVFRGFGFCGGGGFVFGEGGEKRGERTVCSRVRLGGVGVFFRAGSGV